MSFFVKLPVLDPITDFDAWFWKAKATADTVIGFPPFLPQFQWLLESIRANGTLPPQIPISPSEFGFQLARSVVAVLMSHTALSPSKIEIIESALIFFVPWASIGFEHELRNYLLILDYVFRDVKAKIFRKQPNLLNQLAEVVAGDQTLYDFLLNSLSSDSEPLEDIVTFSVTILPAVKFTTNPDFCAVSDQILTGVLRHLERDFRGTNSQPVCEIFSALLAYAPPNFDFGKWLNDLFAQFLSSGMFDKQLTALKVANTLLAKQEYTQSCCEWLHGQLDKLTKVPIHAEFTPLLGTIWGHLAAVNLIGLPEISSLWELHAVQPNSLLTPFFEMMTDVAVSCSSELFPSVINLFLNPNNETATWIRFLSATISAIERCKGRGDGIAQLKGRITELSKGGPLQKPAAEAMAEFAAIGVSGDEFSHFLSDFLGNPKDELLPQLSQLLDRHQIHNYLDADRLYELIFLKVPSASPDNVPLLFLILFKLIVRHHVTFQREHMTQLFELTLHERSAFDLIGRLMEEKRFPVDVFVEQAKTVQLWQVCNTFCDIVQQLFPPKALTVVPFERESLLWNLSAVATRFADLLCRIYANNDPVALPDEVMINAFFTQWLEYFQSLQKPPPLISLLAKFVREIEFPLDVRLPRHPVILDVDLVHIRPEGLKPVWVHSDVSIAAVLQRYKGKDYAKYSLWGRDHYPQPLDSVRSLAGRSQSLECQIVEKPIEPVRERTALPSELVLQSGILDVLYDTLRAGNHEAKNLLDRFPTFPVVSRLMKTIGECSDLDKFFPVAHPAVFLYNFEVLVSEVDVKKIRTACLIHIFRKGLMLQDHNCVNSILLYFHQKWPIPNIQPQILFDSLIVLLRNAIKNPKAGSPIILNVLEFGEKVNCPELRIPNDFGSLMIPLLNAPSENVRSRAVDFFRRLRIPIAAYGDKLQQGLSSEFFSSFADHLTQNHQALGRYLLTTLRLPRNIIEVGHVQCLIQFVKHGWLTDSQLKDLSKSLAGRFLTPQRSERSPAVFWAVGQLLALLDTPEVLTQIDAALKTPSLGKWRIEGDALELNSFADVGLENLGATCFMNAVFQQVFHIEPIRQLVFDYTNGDDPFITALRALFAKMQLSDAKSISTRSVAAHWVSWDGERLDPMRQQDAVEFASALFDKLDGAFPNVTAPIVQLTLANRIELLDGTVISETEDQLNVLALPVENLTTIAESLARIAQPDIVNDYRWGENIVSVRKFGSLKTLPTHLVIQLKRFEYDFRTWERRKITSPFEFGPTLTVGETAFILQGVIIHHGSVEVGHYYSYVRRSKGWICFNDANVRQVNEDTVLNDGKGYGYLLFYVKANDRPPDVQVPPALIAFVGKSNAKLHSRRLLCSAGFFRMMEVWSKSNVPAQRSCAARYLFLVLPFCMFRQDVERIATNVIGWVRQNPEMAATVARLVGLNSVLGCPLAEVRAATCRVALAAIKSKSAPSLFEKMFAMVGQFVIYWETFDEVMSVISEVLRTNQQMRKVAENAGYIRQLEEFVANDFPRLCLEKARAGYTETEMYERVNFTYTMLVLTLYASQLERIRVLCLDPDWIANIIISLTNVEALIILLRAYNQHGEVSAVLSTEDKLDLFRSLLVQLDQK